jgi:hypothetical protein
MVVMEKRCVFFEVENRWRFVPREFSRSRDFEARKLTYVFTQLPLLSDFDQNWNVSTHFSILTSYGISLNPCSLSRVALRVETCGRTHCEALDPYTWLSWRVKPAEPPVYFSSNPTQLHIILVWSPAQWHRHWPNLSSLSIKHGLPTILRAHISSMLCTFMRR